MSNSEDNFINELRALAEQGDVVGLVTTLYNEVGDDIFYGYLSEDVLNSTELTVTEVAQWNDGDGREMWSILEIAYKGKNIGTTRTQGWYSSHGDSEWEIDTTVKVAKRRVISTEWVATDGSEDKQHVFAD